MTVQYRLFISNIPNCEPLREIEITGLDLLGRCQLRRKTKGSQEKAGIFTGLQHSRCIVMLQFCKEKEELIQEKRDKFEGKIKNNPNINLKLP